MLSTLANRTVAALFAAVLLCSCDKDEDEKVSRAQLLTNGQWRLTAAVANPPLVAGPFTITDLYNSQMMQSCLKDNLYKFNNDNTVTTDEGAEKCDPAVPQTSNAPYSLSANEQELTFLGTTLTITELTNSTLKVKGPITAQGFSVNAELTFSK
ncbi:hypothetical protein SAMN05444008_11838 [Cnuella takakiae]|uniref:Lipocalin-like domain-containing protein n=1 Tax=Cnuella takakiae TaxID=1302690 RepID=A0A1M5H581_9BACT|nr:lipocalin family protein [Cnuella takakiae]SHG11157.1 hypothetical protein SAMN05444008_11838 [Cnuella takakiae]